ncbi:MAG: hypothetical protein ABSA30_05125 [Candidatus Aminicenantales bacterium]|jgi:hypothetical protein
MKKSKLIFGIVLFSSLVSGSAASFNNRDPAFIEAQAYDGPLVNDGRFIYDLNSAFGDIRKFEAHGALIAELSLVSSFGKFGQAVFDSNQDLYFHGGLNRITDKRMYPANGLWRDAAVENGKLYIMSDQVIPKIGKRETIDILALDSNSLKPGAAYRLKIGKEDRPLQLAVSERSGSPIFFIATATADGYEIGIFSVEK